MQCCQLPEPHWWPAEARDHPGNAIPLFHKCLCSFLILALLVLILDRCSSLDVSSTNSSFLSAGGHTVLSTEGSWTPTGTPHNCARKQALKYHHTAWKPLLTLPECQGANRATATPCRPSPRAGSSAPAPWAESI